MNPATSLLKDIGLNRSHGLHARALLRLLGAAQGGQFSTRQASALGITHGQILALRDAGEIVNERYAVWRFLSAAEQPDPAVTAFLTCWPLAVISHASAGAFHGLRRVPTPSRPHVRRGRAS